MRSMEHKHISADFHSLTENAKATGMLYGIKDIQLVDTSM